MSIFNRFGALFARRTMPEKNPGRPIAWLPARRGNIIVTQDKALELSTSFACMRAIAEDAAKLPWHVFARSGNTRQRLDNSAISYLLNTRPNPEMGAFSFRETIVGHALMWGNGYAEIERDVGGRVKALWIISPDRVEPERALDGRLVYSVRQERQDPLILEANDVYHLHGIGFDGIKGYSMVGLAAQSLGFAIAAEEHGASFYGNNTTPGLALKTDAVLSDEGFERLQKQMAERKGSARAYEGMILEQGMDFARPNMSQVDAQYVETRRLVIEEVCRWWRVPPHKIGELTRAHFSNVENLNIDYVTDTLMPWVKRLEEEADWKLISNRSQASYTKIAVQALMRGDSAARATYYKEMLHMGVLSPNDIRALEDMDPIGPEGDEHYMQSQFTTLKRINEAPVEQPAPAPSVTRTAARLLSAQLRKAEKRTSYSAEDNLDWVDHQAEQSRTRVEAAIRDIAPNCDIEKAVYFYLEAEREELLAYFNGGNPDYQKVANALLEALQ